MNKLSRIIKIIEFFAIAISIAIAQYTAELAKTKFDNRIMLFVIALAIITIGYELLPLVFRFIFEKSFLKRIFLSNEYIEGTYLDLMKKNGIPVDFGLSRIRIDGEEIRYSGNNYSLGERKSSGSYKSTMIELGFPSMRYMYHYKHEDSKSALLYGYGELDFDERKGEPLHYSGHYIDLSDGEKVIFEGWKVKDKEMLEKLDNPKERMDTIINFFKEASKL